MSLLIALKFVCFYAFYFSVLSVFDLWMNSYLLFLAVLLLSCVSLSLSHKFRDKIGIRIITSLIPIIAFVLCQKPLDYLVVGIPVLATVLLGIFKRANLDYWNYISTFKIVCAIFFVFVLLALLTNLNYYNVMFYGIIALIIGVFVSRELRLGAHTTTKEKLYNIAFVATVPIILAILFLVIFRPNVSFGKVFEYILVPFASIFYLFIKLFSLISNLVVQQEPEPTQEIENVIHGYEEEFIDYNDKPSKDNPIVRTNYDYIFIIATIIIAVIVITIIVIRIIKAMKKDSIYKIEFQTIDSESIFVESEKTDRRSNGYKIRKFYLKYLSLIETYGIFRKKHNTSLDILERASEVITSEKQEELRQLYIKARYSDENSITDEDVDYAKELFKSIKEARKQQLKEENLKQA